MEPQDHRVHRPRVGSAVSAVPPDAAVGVDRQQLAGAPAGVFAVRGSLAQLREVHSPAARAAEIAFIRWSARFPGPQPAPGFPDASRSRAPSHHFLSGGTMIKTIDVQLYGNPGNNAVVKMPNRQNPGIVAQGDTLRQLATDARGLSNRLRAGTDL